MCGYKNGVIPENTVCKWFPKFRIWNFNKKDQERFGRPTVVDDKIEILIKNNHNISHCRDTPNISDEQCKAFKDTCICESLHCLGASWFNKKKKYLIDCITICNSLLKHNKTDPFLKRTVTDNEKWTVYNNVKWKRPGENEIGHHWPLQKLVYIWRRWCCVSGIGRALIIFSAKSDVELDQLKAVINERSLE